MTKRKDPRSEGEPPQDQPQTAPIAEETPAVAPFVDSDPPEPPPHAAPTPDQPTPAEPRSAGQVVVRRGSVFPGLLGGALAAVGGFALAHFDVFGLRPAQDPAEMTAQMTALSQQVAELESRLASLDPVGGELTALGERIGKLESAPAPEVPDLSRLDALDQRLAAIEAMPADGSATTAALTAKLADLERRLAAAPQGASPELQQQLDAALARLDEAEATATARAEEAAAATAAAQRTRALDALATKLRAGEPFQTDLAAVGDAKLTEALSPLAGSGVPTLAQLQAAFPDPAREALRAAREAGSQDGWGARILDFLASQSGARPLTPLEGDTPAAILSRADFALSEGRVADALTELQPLDAAVKAPLDAWIAQAQAHLAADAALQAARGE